MAAPVTRAGELETAAFFDRLALRGEMERFSDEELRVVRRQLRRWRLPRGGTVLEVGCGSCRLRPYLERAVGPEGLVISLDVSLGMLAAARRLGRGVRGPLLAASAAALPLPASRVHRAILFQVLPHLADRGAALREVARVLRPGGTVWIAHALSRDAVNAFHRTLGPPVSTHVLPEDAVLLAEARRAGLRPFHLEDGAGGFLLGLRRD